MMLSTKEFGDLNGMMSRLQKTLETSVAKKTFGAAMLMQKELHDRTPVWSGLAAANHQWSFDSPSGTMVDLDRTSPGHTNNMSLGTEPERSAARAISDQSLNSLRFFQNPFRVVFVTNNTRYPGPDGLTFADLEYGFMPGGPGQVSRTPPGGIYRGAIQVVEEAMK